MSIKADLHDYLSTVTNVDDIFIGGLPERPSNVVTIEQYPGTPPEFIPEQSGPAYEHPSIQVRARSLDPTWAEERAQELFRKLSVIVNMTINGTRYQRVKAISSPFFMGNDQNDRSNWVVNFAVHKEVEA